MVVPAAPVFYDDLLTPGFAQFLREQTRDDIVAAARRIGHDQANGFHRIFLRQRRMGADGGTQRQNKVADETSRPHREYILRPFRRAQLEKRFDVLDGHAHDAPHHLGAFVDVDCSRVAIATGW